MAETASTWGRSVRVPIVCHHCRRSYDHAVIDILGQRLMCDCSEWWIRQQLELGLTPAVRRYDARVDCHSIGSPA